MVNTFLVLVVKQCIVLQRTIYMIEGSQLTNTEYGYLCLNSQNATPPFQNKFIFRFLYST